MFLKLVNKNIFSQKNKMAFNIFFPLIMDLPFFYFMFLKEHLTFIQVGKILKKWRNKTFCIISPLDLDLDLIRNQSRPDQTRLTSLILDQLSAFIQNWPRCCFWMSETLPFQLEWETIVLLLILILIKAFTRSLSLLCTRKAPLSVLPAALAFPHWQQSYRKSRAWSRVHAPL